jgi:hypothetical protein
MDFAPELTIDLLLRLESSPPSPAAPEGRRWVIRGDEELLEYGYESRTSPRNETTTINYKCTPSVFRFFKQPIEQQGDFRVDISPMRSALLALNGGDQQRLDYLFNAGTGIFNTQGYPKQAYVTMSLNQVKVIQKLGEWYKIATLTPNSPTTYEDEQGVTQSMTWYSHPEFVHRFDLVCWDRIDETTYHHPNTPRGIVFYYLTTFEGFAWINSRYVREV